MARPKQNKPKARKDGRFCIQFRFEGKRYSAYGETSKAAEKAAAVMRDQLMAGTYISAKEKREMEEESRRKEEQEAAARIPTFSEYAEEWAELKRGTVKATTMRTTRILVDLVCRTSVGGVAFGSIDLDKVTPPVIRELQRELSKEASTRTTNDSISMIRGIYRSAISDRILVWNPAENIKPLKRTEKRAVDTIHRALTKQETVDFLEAARDSWLYNLYILLLNTGLRCGEACALNVSDVDEDGLNVKRTVTRTEGGAYVVGDDTKTDAGRRFVPLNEEARQAIRDQYALERALRPTKVFGINEPIFKASRGGILHATLVNQDIARICARTGIEKFTAHCFRDTFTTRCIEDGMEVKELQMILGHTDVSMTLGLYAHSSRERRIEQLKAVNFI